MRRGLTGRASMLAAGVGAVVVIWHTGSMVSVPTELSLEGLERWYERVGPPGLLAVAARTVGSALSLWLGTACVLQVIASLPGCRLARRLADLISPRSLQRLGHGLVGLSLTAGLATPAPSAGNPVPRETSSGTPMVVPAPRSDEVPPAVFGEAGTAVMTRVDLGEAAATTVPPTTTTTTTPSSAPRRDEDPAVLTTEPLRPAGGDGTASDAVPPNDIADDPAAERPVAAGPPMAPPAVPAPVGPAPISEPGVLVVADVVTVEPGDSFWSLAEEALGWERSDIPISEVARYWRAVVSANQDRLIDPSNPDLILPGQEMVLPPH